MVKKQVLLLGNGINRAYQFVSWNDLLKALKKEISEDDMKQIECMPSPLKPVVITDDNVGEGMKKAAKKLLDRQVDPEELEMLRQFIGLPMDTILTANYTYELEKSVIPDFECQIGRPCKYRKCMKKEAGKYERTQLYTCFNLSENKPLVWHIHGEAAKSDSMIIGHYYYGKLIAKIQKHIGESMAAYKLHRAGKINLNWNSWVDYFMLGDVFIVGLGMDLSEMDLWWLVSCKKLHFPETRVVLYKPDITPTEKMIADAYHVDVIDDGLKEGDYRSYYRWICDRLNIQLRKEDQ